MSPEILGSIVAGEHCRDVNLLRDGFYRQIRVKTIDNTHIYCVCTYMSISYVYLHVVVDPLRAVLVPSWF